MAATVDLAALAIGDFSPHLDAVFDLQAAGGVVPLKLAKADPVGDSGRAGGRVLADLRRAERSMAAAGNFSGHASGARRDGDIPGAARADAKWQRLPGDIHVSP